jgi:predicted transposase YbfD/YdcC
VSTERARLVELLQHLIEIERRKLHPLPDILFITLCASICGAESWRDIVDYAHEQSEVLKSYIDLEHGVPSKSTLARVFSLLDPQSFRQCFINWAQALHDVLDDIVTIDAMGCQTAIANKIVAKEADYVLALKGNHSTLHDDVRTFLDTEAAKPALPAGCHYHEETDCGHGRIAIRRA